MARWAAGAKWAAGAAPDNQRDTPLVLSLSEWLGPTRHVQALCILFSDLEAITGSDYVGGKSTSTDLAAVVAMAEDLSHPLAITGNALYLTTYAGLAVPLHLVTDVTANTSSGRHLNGLSFWLYRWFEWV